MSSYIPRTILAAAERFPDKEAYIYENEKLSYGELSKRAMVLAAYLGKGKPVMLYGHKSPSMIIGILACLICGRAYIPCDSSLPDERVRSMLLQSGADTVVAENGSPFFENVRTLSEADIYALPKRKCQCADDFTDAYMIFTSGSTGTPKGIKVSRRSLESFISYAVKVYPSDGEIFGGHALFSFDLSVADIFVPLMTGRTFHAFDKFPAANVNIITCTPSYLRMCLLSKKFSPEEFAALRTILCCGEILPVRTASALYERFPEISLINAYGPAECCCFVSAHTVTESDISGSQNSIPIGDENFTASEILLEDNEIFICGESAMNEYIGSSDEGFKNDGYYTGDSGKTEKGHIYFTGRKNGSTVKYSGYRIELGEIETVLCETESISDCCVQAISDENGTVKLLKAFVISETDIDGSEIKKQLAKKLPAYMIPKVIKRTSELPANNNGKLQRTGRETP